MKEIKDTNNIRRNTKAKRILKMYSFAIVFITIFTMLTLTALGATNDPLVVINNLSTFVFGVIRAIGLLMIGFAIVQLGLSLKSHDASGRANAFLTLAGGIIITFSKEILDIITGG